MRFPCLNFPSFEVDHIFIHPQLYDHLSVHLYETEFFKFKTDHKYMIAFEIQSPPLHPDVHDVESITGRYHLKRLSNQKTLELFRNRWSELSESRRHEYFTCTDVDVLNDSLTGMVGDISAEVLGVYHVQQTKTKTDTYSQDLMKSPKAVATIQLFKQHMRSQANRHRIVPMDEKGDMMQECIAPLQISSTTPPQLTTVARLNYIIPIPRTMSYLFYGSTSYGISSKSILSTKPAVMMAFTPSFSVPCSLRLSQSSSQGWQSAGKTGSPDPRPTRYYASRSGSVMRSCFNSRVRSEVEADPIIVGSGSIKGYKPPRKCRSGHEMWSGFPGF